MNEIETNVLELIGEDVDSPDVFTDDSAGMVLIRESINDAIEEITMVTGTVQRTYKQPIRGNACFYRFDFSSERVAYIKGVWLYSIQRRLTQTDFIGLTNENPKWLYDSGSPHSYFMIGEKYFGIYPIPTASSDLLEIKTVVIPNRYTEDVDRIKLRDSFKNAATVYAAGEYYASRGNAKQAKNYHNQYLQILGIAGLYPASNERVYQLGMDRTQSQNPSIPS